MKEENKKFLPIGTVVLLKGGTKELMIISYCIIPTGKVLVDEKEIEGQNIIFDYGACIYPEGVINSDQIYGFNHDDIDHISHMGYETDSQKEFSNGLEKALKDMKKVDIEEVLSIED